MKENELRELDAWIAEHVMGVKCAHVWRGHSRRKSICGKCGKVSWNGDALSCDAYTTDYAAALQVLEKCLEKSGYGLIVDIHDDAGFSIEQRSPFRPCSTGEETLPLTICRFAKNLYENPNPH